MKISTKTLLAVCAVISLSISAQTRNGGNNPRGNNQNQNQNPSPNTNPGWTSNNNGHTDAKRGGGQVNIHIGGGGGYPGGYYGNSYGYSYGYNNYNNNYGGYYNVKRAARGSIQQSAGVIGQALQFTGWNDIYSPWLAKAIRHQQYAKQLYFWGDYAGALNHAERAGFLAWNTLNYFNSGYGYNNYGGGSYPDPYSDPNNPYYRQNNSGNQPAMDDMNSGNGYDYSNRRSANSPDNSQTTSESSQGMKQAPAQKMELSKIDESLPMNKVSDRDLLKMGAKDLDIE